MLAATIDYPENPACPDLSGKILILTSCTVTRLNPDLLD